MNTRDPDSAEQLLEAALANPFDFDAVRLWFGYLIREFPLWSFQPWSYARHQPSSRPGTYPLQLLVDSILRDDGIDPHRWLDPLPKMLDEVRRQLARGSAVLAARAHAAYPRGGPPSFRAASDLSLAPPDEGQADPDDPSWFISPYEEIGRRLVDLIEQRADARNAEERAEAHDALDAFLKEIEAEAQPGPPEKGPGAEILKALITEGRELFKVCRDLFPLTVGDQTRVALHDQGIRDPDEQQVWVASLSLPVLARCELLALRDEKRAFDQWKRGSGQHPTAKRLAVWILAHRLDLGAHHLHRKACNHDDKRYFKDRPNPIAKHL